MDLQAINTEVVAASVGMLGEDERQGDERPAVLRPGGHRREPVQPHLVGDDVGHRAAAHAADTDPEQLGREVPCAPQRRRSRRQRRLDQLDQPADQPLWPLAKCQLSAARGPEQVGDERKVGVADVREEQRRPPRGHDPAMDLGGLECRGHRRGDLDKVTIASEAIEKGTQVGEGHTKRSGDRRPEAGDRRKPAGPPKPWCRREGFASFWFTCVRTPVGVGAPGGRHAKPCRVSFADLKRSNRPIKFTVRSGAATYASAWQSATRAPTRAPAC